MWFERGTIVTQKLFLDDSYSTRCEARVFSCVKAGNGYDVELTQTVLFPTGGGQPHDTGTIGGVNVLDVSEEGERVLHRVDAPLEEGAQVTAELFWPRRFDHMQQHSGEHLLSFAAKELFGAKNVGFHMAASYCTVDLDVQLTAEDVIKLEQRTNELITANLPVELTYVQAEELEQMELRKRAAGLTGTVRIVAMPGGDSCTCCGTHVKQTGEIGALKITANEHYKGGERLTFACGGRALIHAQRMQGIVDGLARAFSCKTEDVLTAVDKLQQEYAAVKRELKSAQAKLSGYIAAELLSGAAAVKKKRLVARFLPDYPAAQLRSLALALCEGGNTLALLLAKNGESANYVLCCSEGLGLDMGELAQAVNAATSGRGGGRGILAQGSAKLDAALEDTVSQLAQYLTQRLAALK